jgi:hypothetical protein
MLEEKTTPETPKKCRTVTINDVPEKKDAFNGPHEKVATAIYQILISDEEVGGKMIGLEGGWGSGKSTVVSLIQKKLEVKTNVAVFYFDTWAHEGDPLRRTFLESLIRFFRDKSWVDKNHWRKRLQLLSKRRRITKTKTIPKPTKLGFLIAISALLVPIGAPFVTDALKNGVTINTNQPIYWQFVFGMLLICMPICIVIGNAAKLAFQWLKKSKEQRQKEKAEKNDPNSEPKPSSWAFWGGSSVTEIYNDTTETPEPTSIEFEDTFTDLMASALPNDSGKKVVVILDNLDRVDADYALGIWSTLQTFLQQRHHKEEQWFEKLWILVPFDRKGLSNLWAKGQNGATVANSFIDKSFQLRFEVPPMITSNWKEYLFDLLRQALPDHSDADFNEIYRVYNSCSLHFKESPTPRQLKIFTNDLGSIHRQWEDKFPLSHAAYYVILKKRPGDIIQHIISWEEQSKKIEVLLGPELKESLAGLAYNVDGETGLQLILKAPIKEALAGNKPDTLKKLMEKHKGGFWVVFEEIITEEIADFDAGTLANLSSCILSAEIFTGKKQHEIDEIRKRIKLAAENHSSWSINTKELSGGFKAINTLVSDVDFSSTIFEKARNTVKVINTGETPISNEEFIENLSDILSFASESRLSEALEYAFELPLAIEQWVDTCPIIKKLCQQSLWSNIYPSATSEQLVQLLVNTINGGAFLDKHIDAIEVSGNSYDSVNWNPIIAAIEVRLDVNNAIQNKDVEILVKALQSIRKFDAPSGQNSLKKLTDGGQLLHWIHQAHAQNQKEFIAWPMLSYLEQSPGVVTDPNVGNSTAGKNSINNILSMDDEQVKSQLMEILLSLGNFKVLFDVLEFRDDYDLFTNKCLLLAIDDRYYKQVYSTPNMLAKWYWVRGSLEKFDALDSYDELIEKLSISAGLTPDIETNADGFNIYDTLFYSDIVDLIDSNGFENWCIKGLQSVSSSEWLEALEKSEDLLSLLISLVDKELKVNLGVLFVDSLENYAKKLLEGTVSEDLELFYKEDWDKILEGITEEDLRTNLRRKIVEVSIKNYEGKIGPFLELYGRELIGSDILNQKSSDIIDKIFSKIINDKNLIGLNWIKTLLTTHPKFVENCKDTVTVNPFLGRLKAELKVEDGSVETTIIKEIAGMLNVVPDPVEEPEPTTEQDEDKNENEVKK